MRRGIALGVGSSCLAMLIAWAAATAQRQATYAAPEDANETVAQLDRLYAEWRVQRAGAQGFSSQADVRAWFRGPAWEGIVELGPRGVPAIMAKLQEDHALGYALHQITRFRYHPKRTEDADGARLWIVEEFPDLTAVTGPPDAVAVWCLWYSVGREWVPERFTALYAEYSEVTAAGEGEQAGAALRRIAELGIAVLPSLAEAIAEGDQALVAIASELSGGAVAPDTPPEQYLRWWEVNGQDWLIPWPEETTEE